MNLVINKNIEADISIEWNNSFNVYFLKSLNELGDIFFKEMKFLKSKIGKSITKSQINRYTDLALKMNLTIKTINNNVDNYS